MNATLLQPLFSSRAARGLKFLFGRNRPGRAFRPEPDDTFLVSYPKSGNTWLRFLLANLRHPEVDFRNIERLVPDVEGTSLREFRRVPRPRLIKSHYWFDPWYPRVIYIVRDPRDVVISQYHFQRKRRLIQDGYPLETYVERFLAGEVSDYGSWRDHVATWMVAHDDNSSRYLLVRYEDLLASTSAELKRVADFLALAPTEGEIARAIERSSPDAIRRMEQVDGDKFQLTRSTRKDIPFCRSAKAGEWRTALPRAYAERIENLWGDWMERLGYEVR
jgi:hypothetical protein